MLMADTLAIFLVILGLMLALPSLWLLCRGLWPNTVTGAAHVCSDSRLRAFLLGLPITAVIVIIAAALGNTLGPAGKITAAALVCLYLVLANTGVAGFATSVGQRLSSPADAERPWKATLRGGIILELTYLLPILGWFVILPVSIIIGAGAATLALLNLQNAKAASAAQANAAAAA